MKHVRLDETCENRPVGFERAIIVVAHAVAMWFTIDRSVAIPIANPSSWSLALHVGFELGSMSSVAIASPAHWHVHDVAATLAEFIAPLSETFVGSTFAV